MEKGFIGPLGDDLPSVVAIILALSIFFSGLTYALNTYNQKIVGLEVLRGSMDVSRVLTGEGIITEDLDSLHVKADTTARSYGLEFALRYTDGSDSWHTCEEDWYVFNYLVATWLSGEDIELRTLVICIGR